MEGDETCGMEEEWRARLVGVCRAARRVCLDVDVVRLDRGVVHPRSDEDGVLQAGSRAERLSQPVRGSHLGKVEALDELDVQ